MTSLGSWISPSVMHPLGWALIHSLWQDMAVAALTAALMALCRRPSTRYVIGTGALAVMLAVPVAMFFLLKSPATLAPAFFFANSSAPASIPFLADLGASVAPEHSPAAATVTGKITAIASESSIHFFSSWDILPWLVGAWLLGVTILSLRFAGGFLLLEHKRHRQSSAPNRRILEICREMQRQLGLTCAIRYLECSWLQAPAVIGWIRPIVLLPVIALTGFSEEQLRVVIAHELAHIRRLDSFVNLFQILVETLLFYHPAIWWLNKRIRTERELCCDEIAVSLCGNRVAYARALALMEDWRSAPVLAMSANRGSLSERVLYVLDRKSIDAKARMLGLTGGLVLMTAALVAGSASFKIAYPIAGFNGGESSHTVLPSAEFLGGTTRYAPRAENVKRSPGTRPDKGFSNSALRSQSETVLPHEDPSVIVAPPPSLPQSATPIPQLPRTDQTTANVAQDAPNSPFAVVAPPADRALTEGAARTELNSDSASAMPVTHEPQAGPPRPLVHEDQPIGIGDPNATVCRRSSGPNGPDQNICLKNTYWFSLWIRGKSLSPDGRNVLEPLNAPMVAYPTGEGDPDEVVCQKPHELTAARFPSPKLCFRNRYWAKLKQPPKLFPGLLPTVDEQLISALSRG